jgi:hypothetical protein
VARLATPGMDGASAPSSLATSSGQAVSWCQACSRPVALGLVVGVVGALGHAWDRSIQYRRAEVAECEHNREGPYGTGLKAHDFVITQPQLPRHDPSDSR